jgi:hypothetical protein
VDEAARFHTLLIRECDELIEHWHTLRRQEQGAAGDESLRRAAGA